MADDLITGGDGSSGSDVIDARHAREAVREREAGLFSERASFTLVDTVKFHKA